MLRIIVTGGQGFLGRHIADMLWERGVSAILPSHAAYDFRNQKDIRDMLERCQPEVIIHAAATCGGIGLNKERPADLFYDNILMGVQLIHEAYKFGVRKFVQIGTVCEYPKFAQVPFLEEMLWHGYPEETNAPYGIAKKALLVQGQAYRQQYGFNVIHLLPVNLYGPGNNRDPKSSHVVPALIGKFAKAKACNDPEVKIWGGSQVSREFLYVKDAAEAIINATVSYDGSDPINIGSGQETSIGTLASMIAAKIGYQGSIRFDTEGLDGQPRRCLNVEKAKRMFNFEAKTTLSEGLDKTIEWYYSQP